MAGERDRCSTVQDGLPFTALTGFNRSGARRALPRIGQSAAGSKWSCYLGGPNHYYDPSVFSLPNTGFSWQCGTEHFDWPLAETDVSLAKFSP
jgi:hypothetical protein